MEKEQILLSTGDLAKRWGISTATVDRRVREGLISPVRGHKTPQFNFYDVLKAEGTDASKLSPFERRRLERTNKELEQRVVELEEEKEKLKRQLTKIVAEIMPVLSES